jgi:hypothetical protein
MNNFRAQSFRLAMAMMAVGISTSSAHAYLDPGAASLALQVLLGGIAGMALAIKLYWHRFLSLIGAGRQPQESNQLSRERGVEVDERSRR